MSTSRIFIKGLPPKITEAEFRKHFSAGNREVTDIKLIPQRRIGYVGYKSADDAARAVKYFNRSYIRMSKISVESARPISDPALSKGHNGSRNLDAQRDHSAPLSTSDRDVNSKKRKRESQENTDPKLREFLQVMRSGREGAVADQSNDTAGADDMLRHGEVAAPEDESDDEYEQIPLKKEKSRRIDLHQGMSDQVTRPQPPRDEKNPRDNTLEEAGEKRAEAADSEMIDQVPSATAATDDDWLRSRTSRLLDLVDPDDLDSGAVLSPADGTTKQDTEGDNLSSHSSDEVTPDTTDGVATHKDGASEDAADAISRTSRLFVRNLPYSATEDDIQETFEKFGTLEEVHLPLTATGATKGFALVLFADSSDAVKAFQALDGATFQGRILHIIPANVKREQGLDEFGVSKLPLKKQNMIRKKAEAASSSFNWNSLYMSQDAVNSSVASRLGVSKSELLDPTSADAAIKQAIAETTVIQETKAYFAANGVDLDAFKSQRRGDTTILAKNFPYGTTMEELRKMFEEHGQVLKVLMPPTGTIAIVQFAQAGHAKAAFGKLAYRRIKDSVLFLEKAPDDLLRGDISEQPSRVADQHVTGVSKLSVSDLLSGGDKAEEVETTSLFIRNLNFATTTTRLAEAFESLDGFVSARVKTKMDPKKPGQTLSMGFGFAEFRSKTQAQAALKVMDGYVLDGHTLGVKASHKGQDVAEERRREDRAKKAAAQRTKIVIKNLPFQATKKDVRSLFGTYGQLRSVRVPKKADFTARGFAFAEFVTPREAENALNALKDSHLLGRRLVLDFAEAEAVDAEEEIEKMQRKVGGQVNKVALQQLTGGGRKKVTIGNDEEEVDT
ncbi:Multiple RNA-binding domain-containing protein 1 [Metarhizium rileyi]|uniref:Multiple RNA-binding domain-containing protein 1 n=1 Tax=Metarhizium rileyi (strain RCEF 4871) TaxID=1649241 RepID=A0A5C6GC27_METRR|nr:Multiple RNA-binding domain-containing protein 1 [Metarhizium rileyi]